MLATETGQRWYGAADQRRPRHDFRHGDGDRRLAVRRRAADQERTSVRNAWQAYTALADRYNDPGTFTAIIGFEWTAIGGYNLHRNVLFRGDAGVADQTLPFSQFDSKNPEDLWTYMERVREADRIGRACHSAQRQPQQRPHVHGGELRRQAADGRAGGPAHRYEPLIEVTQIKGDGESHPFLSPTDEFAGYEIWDKSNLNGTEAKTPDMLKYEYAREALKTGLKLENELGVNPYKFGMIGSTDSHTSLATAEEENFFGKHSGVEPEPHRWEHVVIEAPDPTFTIHGWQQAASG